MFVGQTRGGRIEDGGWRNQLHIGGFEGIKSLDERVLLMVKLL